jgi:bifunctional non-homologous end joining protein LigD
MATTKKRSAKKAATRTTAAKKRKSTSAMKVSRPTAAKKAVAKRPAARKAAAKVGSLALYNAKRDFSKTAEPEGQTKKTGRQLRFVIQKHAASHLHFDFRLELDGVMKSWAVPKGPSYDPTVKRLAMQVEDHPIEYNKFEGTIPQGQYGGGTVMIWDRGTYEPESGGGADALREGYKRGDLKIRMHGERMQGGWVLVRTRRDDRGKAQWLLIKHRDQLAMEGADIVAAVQTSVVTGRTMEEIAKGRRVWNSNR